MIVEPLNPDAIYGKVLIVGDQTSAALLSLQFHLRHRFQHNIIVTDELECKFVCQHKESLNWLEANLNQHPTSQTNLIAQYSDDKIRPWFLRKKLLGTTMFIPIEHDQMYRISFFDYDWILYFMPMSKREYERGLVCLYTATGGFGFDTFEDFAQHAGEPSDCLVLNTHSNDVFTYHPTIDHIPSSFLLHGQCPDRSLCEDTFKLRTQCVKFLEHRLPTSVCEFIMDFLHMNKHQCCGK